MTAGELNTYKLVKERYIQDVNNTGLYFDIASMKRGAGDEAQLNSRVDSENNRLAQIKPPGSKWMPTLMLTVGQYNTLTEHWKNILAPKSYLMLYVPGGHPSEVDIQFWHAYGNDVFWWADDDHVYSHYDAEGLAHRYRIAKEAEVNGTPDPTPVEETPLPVVSAKKWHIKGKVWFMDIDITAEAE